jgi:hypothetical protein
VTSAQPRRVPAASVGSGAHGVNQQPGCHLGQGPPRSTQRAPPTGSIPVDGKRSILLDIARRFSRRDAREYAIIRRLPASRNAASDPSCRTSRDAGAGPLPGAPLQAGCQAGIVRCPRGRVLKPLGKTGPQGLPSQSGSASQPSGQPFAHHLRRVGMEPRAILLHEDHPALPRARCASEGLGRARAPPEGAAPLPGAPSPPPS